MGLKASVLARALTFAMLLVLTGCSQQSLYSNLSEQEANEMVAVLTVAGLDANKQMLKANTFGVTTAREDFARAVQVLEDNALPRERYDTMGDVFSKEGFVSSPLEERARLNYALSQELAATLSNIDGVVLARVHLAVPPKNDLDDTVAPASASVFIKYRPDFDLSDSVSRIKLLVVHGIENMAYENVTVALFKTQVRPQAPGADVAPLPVQAASTLRMSLVTPGPNNVSAGIAALLAMLLIVVLVLLRMWRARRP